MRKLFTDNSLAKKLKSPINMGGHTQFEIRTLVGFQFGGLASSLVGWLPVW